VRQPLFYVAARHNRHPTNPPAGFTLRTCRRHVRRAAPFPRALELLAPTCPGSLPAAGSKGPGTIRPRDAPPHSSHLSHLNYCAIISRALISSRQGGYMVHAARASPRRATAPSSPNQSLAKHNRKPAQLPENKHQRSISIASFCRNLSAPPPHPTNHDSRCTYPASRFTNHYSPIKHF
jgi:hypothetical protein